MSFGVTASKKDCAFHYDAEFTRADARLYEAKRAGRDRVQADAPLTVAA
jgi:GGDEF domain-containing protein